MNTCLFCKIIAGDLPSEQIYTDDHTVAFVDIGPFEKGHMLVVPRLHAVLLTDLPEAEVATLAVAVQRVGRLLMTRLPCDGFNVLQSNGACATQEVPHVHFHVVPRWNGRPVNWTSSTYDTPDEMAAFAARIREA